MAVDYFDLALSQIISPLGLITIAIFVGIIVLFKYYSKVQPSYKTKKLEEVLSEDFENRITVMGIRHKHRLLRKGYHILGRVIKSTDIFFIKPTDDKTSKKGRKVRDVISKKDKSKIKETDARTEFIELAIIPLGFFAMLKGMLGLGHRYVLIDKEYLVDPEHNTDFIIEEQTQYWNIGGINIFSSKGIDFVSEIVFKKIHEQNLESGMNFYPLQTYLQVKQSEKIARAREFTRLEKDRWSSKLEDLTDDKGDD